MKKLLIALITLSSASCLQSEAQDHKKITAMMNNGQFQCQSMGAVEACGVRLYGCTDGLRRFDVICGVNITIERW